MIRTLYFRLVATFIGVVIISLMISFFTANLFYRQDIEKQIQQTIVRQGKEIISLYQQYPSKNLDSYLKSISRLNYDIWLFTNSENGKYFSLNPTNASRPFTKKDIQHVKNGGIYYGKTNTKSVQIVGLPFQIHGQPYALFIKLNEMSFRKEIDQIINMILFVVFIVGSLLIVVACQYLVRPLKAMTAATKKLAQGNFDIDVQVKQKDELGKLAHSFNAMAKELQEIEQMRQDFISNVSHEIQSPLTSIRGYSEMLKDKTISAEERTAFLDIIQLETERLSRLSENLLKLASLESNHHPFHPVSYRLDEQLRRLVAFLEPQWVKKHLNIDVKLEKVYIFADEDQLSQVWLNLLSNSIKFTPDGGRIRIRLTSRDHQIIVQITDTGIGIPTDVLPHIFDRFYTGDPARNRLKSGNGLGLSIAKKIVELHDGQIKVNSEAGKWTTFTITLPKQI